MSAATFATVASFLVVGSRKNIETIFDIIIFAFLQRCIALLVFLQIFHCPNFVQIT